MARSMLACLFLAVALLIPAGLSAAEDEEPQAWLLTYGPGEIYWQRFGHNAIWIRDSRLGLDHTFNFGFFDFRQEGFLRNFLLGRLHYFAAARPAQVELAEYIDDDRSIRAQKLDLDPTQVARLTGHLLNQVTPENREYLYDYYRHNCSTRVRDALDIALDGAVSDVLIPTPGRLDYRDHTRRLTGTDFWLYLGLEIGLGSPVDLSITRWQEAFIPGVLAQAMQDLENPANGRPAVAEDVMLHESALPPPPDAPQSLWYRYLILSVFLVLAAWLSVMVIPQLTSAGLAGLWLVVSGLAGSVLAFLWAFTDHWSTELNLNLLLLNPLWLLIVAIPLLRRPGAWLIGICGLFGAAGMWLPPGQFNIDVAAFVLPLNLAAAVVLARQVSVGQFRE